MYRKKEIWIIIIIILFTVCLAVLPSIISCSNRNVDNDIEETTIEVESTTKNTITITVTGELAISELEIEIPYGATYGYLITKISAYLNQYSLIDSNLSERYYSDTTITIRTSDNNSLVTVEVDHRIKINTADYDELVSLYGIGDKRANSIINYRKTKAISSWAELRKLLGVSDAVIEKIKEKAIL